MAPTGRLAATLGSVPTHGEVSAAHASYHTPRKTIPGRARPARAPQRRAAGIVYAVVEHGERERVASAPPWENFRMRRRNPSRSASVREQWVRQVDEGQSVVTILEPASSGLPFALALRLGGDRWGAPATVTGDAFELHYVLAGEGEFLVGGGGGSAFPPSSALLDSHGVEEFEGAGGAGGGFTLKAGDSILIPPGVPHALRSSCEGNGSCVLGGDFGFASLVVVLPKTLFEDRGPGVPAEAVEALNREARAVAHSAARGWRGQRVGKIPGHLVEALFAGAELGIGPDSLGGSGLRAVGHGARAVPDASEGMGVPAGSGLGQWAADTAFQHANLRHTVMVWVGDALMQGAHGPAATGGGGRARGVWPRGGGGEDGREGLGGGEGGGPAAAAPPAPALPVILKALERLAVFRLPNQSNRLAMVFDPVEDSLPFTFAVEIFEEGHVTPKHEHAAGYEMFLILKGAGVAHCDGEEFEVRVGDVVVFPPGSTHALDVPEGGGRVYCLELMVPNDAFAEYVRGLGLSAGNLSSLDLCDLISVGCGGGGNGGGSEGQGAGEV